MCGYRWLKNPMNIAAASQRALFVFMDTMLPVIPCYRPFQKGIYTTTPSLLPLGTDFGNGILDVLPLQLDQGTTGLLENKRQIQSYRPLILLAEFDSAIATAAIEQLAAERDQTQVEVNATFLRNIAIDRSWMDTELSLHQRLEALSLAIAEDIAVVQINPDGTDRNAFLSIAAPSRWAPEEKIGRSFIATHTPVPHMEKTLSASGKLQHMLIEKGPFVRFTWGISTTPALDTHPVQTEPPYAGGDAFLRVERQVIRRIPGHPAFIFTIRVTVEPLSAVRRVQADAQALAAALRSMDAKSRLYKSVDGHIDALCGYLLAHS